MYLFRPGSKWTVVSVYYCCTALFLLQRGNCVPRRVTDSRSVDGQRQEATDAPTTGAKARADRMTEALHPGADPFGDAAPPPGPPPSDTSAFLRELRRFLGDVSPLAPEEPAPAPVQLRTLRSLPPLALGRSSSETLLVGLLNSSSPTVFSFPPGQREGELALPPHLLEELRRRLRREVERVTELMGEVEVAQGAVRSLERLEALSAFPREDPPAGECQYRAFLLTLALQTVARAYEVQRGLRATRAGQDGGPARANICGLQSLVVSLDTHLVGPNRAAINNCQGVCGFPLHNGNNHAILLNAQIQSGAALGRGLCCVPVTYEDLQVVELNKDGTYLSIKPNMVAKECGCR